MIYAIACLVVSLVVFGYLIVNWLDLSVTI